MASQRDKLTQALREEFSRTEPELDDFARGVAAALQRRGITGPVPGAHRAQKPWSRTVIETLMADKKAAEEAEARKQAARDAPPPAHTTAELVKRALRVQAEKLNAAEDAGTPALNSSALLKSALGGQNGSINGGGQW